MAFNRFSWDNYLQTKRGRNAVKDFSLLDGEPMELTLSFRYNERMRMLYENDDEAKGYIRVVLDDYWNNIIGCAPKPQSMEEAKSLYEDVISNGLTLDGNVLVKRDDFKFCLGMNTWITWLLFQLAPEYFFPNLFEFQAYNLYKTADAFDMELPKMPKKPDYKGRCMYYWHLCETFYKFRTENKLSPAELCAFLYDYAPNFVPHDNNEMPQPSNVWMIGGKIDEREIFDTVFWQGNQSTKRGDILVHYETSPVSAITHIWRAATDGLTDPFFYYYGCVYITDSIKVPAISMDELKKDEHFSTHPLVRKNMQGINGWAITSDDYSRLLEMIAVKGMDIEKLPKLYAPGIRPNESIKIEEDVERLLLEPLLNSMGFTDYKRRLPVKAGRGHRIIPDYALHYCDKLNEERADVLIEAKYHMKTPQDIEDAFLQARSYAKLLDSSVIVLCDKECLLIYEHTGWFDRHRYTKYFWDELSNPDNFNSLKRKMSLRIKSTIQERIKERNAEMPY